MSLPCHLGMIRNDKVSTKIAKKCKGFQQHRILGRLASLLRAIFPFQRKWLRNVKVFRRGFPLNRSHGITKAACLGSRWSDFGGRPTRHMEQGTGFSDRNAWSCNRAIGRGLPCLGFPWKMKISMPVKKKSPRQSCPPYFEIEKSGGTLPCFHRFLICSRRFAAGTCPRDKG